MSSESKTLIFDYSTSTTYIGEYHESLLSQIWKRIGGSTFSSAHSRLVDAAGIDPSDCLAGALNQKSNGSWEISQNSSSINEANGYGRSANGNRFLIVKKQLEEGDYKRVSDAGSVNNGSRRFAIA